MKLTSLETYNAMTQFLVSYYEKTKSGYIGSLLGDLQFLSDKQTADPAAWDTWLKTIHNQDKISPEEAYFYMITFIKRDFYYQEDTQDCKSFWEYITPINDIIPPQAQGDWNNAVHFVLTHEDSRKYIQWEK
jgi:hypothetical protein